MKNLLRMKELSFSYTGGEEHPVLSCTDVILEKHKIHLLFGQPESGKTSLARILSALTPRYFNGTVSGELVMNTQAGEIDLLNTEPFDLLPYIGMVSQNPEEQIIMSECEDEIIFPLENMGLSNDEITFRLDKALAHFGLEAYRHANPADLSGGEKKRLMLAVLDAVDPDLWILDETFEELDEYWREWTASYLKSEQKSVLFLASRQSGVFDACVDHWGLISGAGIRFSPREEILKEFDDQAEPLIQSGNGPDYDKPAMCSCRDISFSYNREPSGFSLAVDSLDLWSGEIVSFYGPNGSGKTTISKILCGLLESTAGEIRFDGKLAASSTFLNATVAYLFQNPDFQIFLPTVREELSLGLEMQGVLKSEASLMIEDAAKRFSLPELSSPPAMMSYGARKRLQAATIYLLQRRVCIIDEMDSGLSRREFVRIVGILKERYETIILITHDRSLAKLCSNRIISLEQGRMTGEQILCR